MGSASGGADRPTDDADKSPGGRSSAYLSAAILGAILIGTIVVVRLSLTGSEATGSAAAAIEQNTTANEAGGEKPIDKLAEAIEVAREASPRPVCGESSGRGRVTDVVSGKRIRVVDGDCTMIVEYAGVRGFPSPSHSEVAATRNAALVSGADVRLEFAGGSEFPNSVFFSDVFVGDELISETLVGLGLLDVDLENSVSLYGQRLKRARGELAGCVAALGVTLRLRPMCLRRIPTSVPPRTWRMT